MNPPSCTVDLWPDLSDLAPEEMFPTTYKRADGSAAHVSSSTVKPTVLRHFKWMRNYGIDGVWVQRFASQLNDPRRLRRVNTVLRLPAWPAHGNADFKVHPKGNTTITGTVKNGEPIELRTQPSSRRKDVVIRIGQESGNTRKTKS